MGGWVAGIPRVSKWVAAGRARIQHFCQILTQSLVQPGSASGCSDLHHHEVVWIHVASLELWSLSLG